MNKEQLQKKIILALNLFVTMYKNRQKQDKMLQNLKGKKQAQGKKIRKWRINIKKADYMEKMYLIKQEHG